MGATSLLKVTAALVSAARAAEGIARHSVANAATSFTVRVISCLHEPVSGLQLLRASWRLVDGNLELRVRPTAEKPRDAVRLRGLAPGTFVGKRVQHVDSRLAERRRRYSMTILDGRLGIGKCHQTWPAVLSPLDGEPRGSPA